MAPRRKQRSSSDSSSLSEKRKLKKAKRMYTYRKKHISSSSRRRERSSSSDFQDFRRRHKYSPSRSRRHHRSRRDDLHYSKRRTTSSDSSESDGYQYRRHRASKTRRKQKKRSYTRKQRIYSSPDYSPIDFHRRPIPALTFPEFKREETDSDIEILEEKISKKKRCRSSSKERLNMYRLYEKSDKYFQEGKLNKALKCIKFALDLNENQDDKLLSKIYSRRGTIYYLNDKPRCSFQAFTDWEHAFMLDNENIESREYMSKVLFMGANKYYQMKAYSKALVAVMHAVNLHKGNGEASILLTLIQKKLAEKKKKKEITTEKALTALKPCIKTDSEKALDVRPASYFKNNESVFGEIERLNKLAGLALEENNYPRAIIYVNKALRWYKEMPQDLIFDRLFELKQVIMNNVTRCPELTSD